MPLTQRAVVVQTAGVPTDRECIPAGVGPCLQNLCEAPGAGCVAAQASDATNGAATVNRRSLGAARPSSADTPLGSVVAGGVARPRSLNVASLGPAYAEKFWARVGQSEAGRGCREWTGSQNGKGYGIVACGQRENGKPLVALAHRVAFELAHGPTDLVIDHLCRNRACCNPHHLEAVDVRTNNLRGEGPAARAIRMNQCLRGHQFTPENTLRNSHGRRSCRACHNAARRAARKAGAA